MPGTYDDSIERADAQALMPEDVAREILQETVTRSAALQLFRTTPMSRAQQRKPALTAFPISYWVGGDTGLKQTTEQLWGNKYLNAGELACIVPVPQSVFDDQDYDMWSEVQPRIAESMGEKLDAAIFFGDDIPAEWTAFDGIVPEAVAAGHEVQLGDGDDIGIDISNAMAFVEDDGFDVSGHAGPRRLRSQLRNARASGSGEPIYQNIGDAGSGQIFGETYAIFGNGAWDGSVLDVLGAYEQGLVGIRQDITYRVFTEGVVSDESGNVVLNLMQQDSTALRAVARFAFVVANNITRQRPEAVDADRYPFAVMQNGNS
jgi:HK97 family phage major capsid protein